MWSLSKLAPVLEFVFELAHSITLLNYWYFFRCIFFQSDLEKFWQVTLPLLPDSWDENFPAAGWYDIRCRKTFRETYLTV